RPFILRTSPSTSATVPLTTILPFQSIVVWLAVDESPLGRKYIVGPVVVPLNDTTTAEEEPLILAKDVEYKEPVEDMSPLTNILPSLLMVVWLAVWANPCGRRLIVPAVPGDKLTVDPVEL